MKYLEVGVFLLRSASDLPFFSASVSILPRRALPPCRRLKISFRKKEKFLAEENLFPCGRKNIFLRKEILASSERKFCAVRKEKNFCAQGNKFPHMRKYFFVYTEIKFRIYGNLTPCKPAGNAGSEKGKFDRRKGGFPWAKRGWFSWLRRRSTGAVREGGRRREVGWGAYKKVGSGGRRAPCPTANSFRCASCVLISSA